LLHSVHGVFRQEVDADTGKENARHQGQVSKESARKRPSDKQKDEQGTAGHCTELKK